MAHGFTAIFTISFLFLFPYVRPAAPQQMNFEF